uniref:Serine aminopeptidase S33 domain-containing protein n=1 Tax=Ditylum brightwellii TaxID=49249 RepID=A0A7S4QEP4_9STRA
MCCCCPSAVSALFCLWVRSGFSKDSVAGALTFFPPDPSLYKFGRTGKDGETLPEESDDIQVARLDQDDDIDDDFSDYDDEDVLDEEELGDIELSEKNDCGGRANGNATVAKKLTKKEEVRANSEKSKNQKKRAQKKKEKSPTELLTERSIALRKRAKVRNARDALDAANGVTYTFIPNPNISRPPHYSAGTISAVKIGPQPQTGTFIAALVYRLNPSHANAKTKTILYSHGNATDVGAMNLTQSFLARHLNANVIVYDYSGYGQSGGVPMEKNTYRDIKLVYEWTAKHLAYEKREESIVVYGQSVGSGPSCYIAKKRQNIGGLILHSPFTSGMRVLTPSRYVISLFRMIFCLL